MLTSIEECAHVTVKESRLTAEEMLKNDDVDVSLALQEIQQMNISQDKTLQIVTALRIAKECDRLTREMFHDKEPYSAASAFRLVHLCLSSELFNLALQFARRGVSALRNTTNIPIEV
jgi:hypothetical protein